MVEITIAGHPFNVATHYVEGQQLTLTAGEAAVFNKARRDSLRNNLAGQIKKALGDATLEWTPDNVVHWQAELDKFDTSYQLGTRVRGGRGPSMDPLTKLAIEEAEAAIVMATKEQGQVPPKGKQLRELAHEVLDGPQGDRFRTLAKRRLRATKEASELLLPDLKAAAE